MIGVNIFRTAKILIVPAWVIFLCLFVLNIQNNQKVYAAANSIITIQGKIVDKTNGTNLTSVSAACINNSGADSCNIRVSIYDDNDGGANLLWQEIHENVELGDTGGIFSLSLNSICGSWSNPTGSCSGDGIIWGAADLYIELEVDTDGDDTFAEVFPEAPEDRPLFTSVPYAYYADVAGSVAADSLDFSEFKDSMTLDASTVIGLGASDFNFTLLNNGSGNVGINLTSTGSFNVQSNGSPFAIFNSSGSADILGDLFAGSETAGIKLSGTTISSAYAPDVAGPSDIPLTVTSTGLSVLTLNGLDGIKLTGGNVAVGTDPTAFKFAVVGSSTGLALVRSTGANNAELWIDNDAGGNQSSIKFANQGTMAWQIGKQTDNTFFIYDSAHTRSILITDTLGNLLLAPAGGTIGIGTFSPAALLDVQGAAEIGSGSFTYPTTPAQAGLTLYNSSAVGRLVMNDGDGYFNLYVNAYRDAAGTKYAVSSQAATRMRMHTGTISFEVAAAGTAGNTVTWTSGLNINSSGYVGLGIDATQKLEVSGGIQIQNGNIMYSKNSSGGVEAFLWPRWTDNATYLNYGSAGFNIRNSSSVSTMFLSPAGNVGIGTSTTTYKFNITDTIYSSKSLATLVNRTDAKLLLYDFGTENWAGIGVNGNGDIQYKTGTSGSNYFVMTNAGRFAVGHVSPCSQLAVSNTTIQGVIDAGCPTLFSAIKGTTIANNETLTGVLTNQPNSNAWHAWAVATSNTGAFDWEYRFLGNGNALADGGWSGSGADVAEVYTINGPGEPGDLVSISTAELAQNNPGKTLFMSVGKPYDTLMTGVISTNPGLVAGIGGAENMIDPNFQLPEKPVALSGRVPVKVNLENGPIKAGDFLTSSSTPGVAMKATKTGRVLGQAMEDYDGSIKMSLGVLAVEEERLNLSAEYLPLNQPQEGVGKIMVFVNLSWYIPEILEGATLAENCLDNSTDCTLDSNYPSIININDSSIDADKLHLALSLTDLISIQENSVVISGNLIADIIQVKQINISSNRVGSFTINSEQTSYQVDITGITESSKVILTPKSQVVSGTTYWVENYTDRFIVKLSTPATNSLTFDYIVLN